MNKAIPYYRVSTEKQGQSGLGLDAQQKSVHDFAQSNSLELLPEFIEVESGRNNKRPVLHDALLACRKQKAVLLIARIDRLSRNVAFISKLMESRVEFVAVDNPKANKLVVHILAAFAEYERDVISTRTREALQAAKLRGVELGSHARHVLSKRNRQAADDFALRMHPMIALLRREGFKTVRQLSDELNRQKIPTYRGNECRWHPYTVHSIIKRFNDREASKESKSKQS